MKWVALVLAIVTAFLGYQLKKEHSANALMQTRINELTERVDAADLAASLAAMHANDAPDGVETSICAQKASSLYSSLGYKENGKPTDDLIGSTYQSHYNPQLKRCLMLLRTSGMAKGSLVSSETITDVDERAQLGQLDIVSTKDRHDAPPIGCTVKRPGSPAVRCASRAEWDSFVRSVME